MTIYNPIYTRLRVLLACIFVIILMSMSSSADVRDRNYTHEHSPDTSALVSQQEDMASTTNSIIIRFEASTSAEERSVYLQSIAN